MSKMLIICIESPLDKSDHIYIQTLLKRVYEIDSNVKLAFVSLDSKYNYNKPHIEKKIKSLISQSSYNEYNVIMCLDTDNSEQDVNDKIINDNIKRYCELKNINLVWFCRTIEEVIWKTKVHTSEKTAKAQSFARKRNLVVDIDSLNNKILTKKKSNLLIIFDKFLSRKS